VTTEQFAFWERAFLAAMQGELASQNEDGGNYCCDGPVLAENCEIFIL